MHGAVVKVDQQMILGTEPRNLPCPLVFLLGRTLHEAIFHTGSSPLPVLCEGFGNGITAAAHIVEVKPYTHTLFAGIGQQPLYVAGFLAGHGVGVGCKFRSVPVGVEHQITEALLCREINHAYPGGVGHGIGEAVVGACPVDAPVPHGHTGLDPREVIGRVGVGIEQFDEVGIYQTARTLSEKHHAPRRLETGTQTVRRFGHVESGIALTRNQHQRLPLVQTSLVQGQIMSRIGLNGHDRQPPAIGITQLFGADVPVFAVIRPGRIVSRKAESRTLGLHPDSSSIAGRPAITESQSVGIQAEHDFQALTAFGNEGQSQFVVSVLHHLSLAPDGMPHTVVPVLLHLLQLPLCIQGRRAVGQDISQLCRSQQLPFACTESILPTSGIVACNAHLKTV